jgi:hypothetical protein
MFSKKFFVSGVLSMVAIFTFVCLSGCGGSSSPVSVAVKASAATVDATDAVTLTATVTNDAGTDGVTWSVSGGGTLSNTTTTSATYTAPAATSSAQTVTVTATSVADTTKIGTTTITVPAALAVTTTISNLAGNVGTPYLVQLAGTGGISPYIWNVASGSTLPAGLSLSTAGVISGTPLAAGAGTTNVAFVMKDSGTATPQSVTQTLGVTIIAAPAIAFSGTMPATATYNAAYTGSAAASGGVGTLTYSLASGSLPTGLNPINSSTGAITGTPTAVGTFNFKVTAADGYGDSVTSPQYTITVSAAVPTLTFAAIPAETYGNAPFTVSASSASSGAITYSVTSGPATIAGSTVTITGAGQVVLGASQTASGNYGAATGSTSFTVGKATATINVTPYSLTYDANAHTATGTATGVGGANLIADLTLSGTTHTSAGTYASDAWSFTDPSGNYANASGTVSDLISKATATINVTLYSVTYDGNAHTATGTATGVGGANLIADLTLSGTTHTSAGTYASDAWSFTDPNGNYSSASGTVSDLISKATAIVNVTPYSVTYDGNPHTASATATGVGGATLSATDFTLTGTTHTSAGTYAGDAWSFTDPNYASTSGTVSDTISVATAIVNVTPYTVTFDGTAHTATATATGAGGATLSATDFTLTGTTHTNVGTYAGDAWSFADPNYASLSGTVTDTISKATAIINVTPYSVTYDGNPHTASATATGAGGVTLSATDFTLTGTTHTNVGTYAGDAWSFADPSGNYANASGSVSDTISKATAIIIVTPYSVTYDGNPHTATGTAMGVGGANLNADLTLSGTTHTDAGSYATDPWSFSDASGNYANANGTVTDTINGMAPSLSFVAIPPKVYGTPPAGDIPFTVSTTTASSGAITYSVTSGPATISGNTVTLTGSGTVVLGASQVASGNYATATASTSFAVNPTLSITTTSPLPTGVVGAAYSQQLQGAGGNGTYSWGTDAGGTSALSALGLSLSSTGLVAGATPVAGGPSNVTVTLSDGNGHTAQATFSVTVTTNITITTMTLSPTYAYIGSSYSATINALGGASPYTWTVSSGGSALAAAGLSLSTGTGLSNTISGNVPSGTTSPVNFTVMVVDHNGISTTVGYSLPVYGALSLTTPSSTIPGPAIIGQSYTGNGINASGGTGSYSWAVTGLTSGLTYNPNGNSLVISGTAPSTSQTIDVSVTLTDTTTGKTYGPITYTISVGPPTPLTLPAASPNPLPSGTINQSYNGAIISSGGSGSGYVWSINGSQVNTDGATPFALSDGLNAYSHGPTLNITGNLGSTPQTITLTNVTVTDSANDNAGPVTYTITVNPIVPTGYTVSGTVNYTGTNAGWIYLELTPNNGCSGCSQNLGTAIDGRSGGPFTSPIAYTIHGVPAGTYTLQAYMDGIGFGIENASDPTGSLSNLNVTSSGLSNQNFTLHDPAAVSLGTLTPTWDPSQGSGVFSGGAVIGFDPICNGSGCNNGGVEMPASYNLQYSTDSTFVSGVSSKCFPANGGNNPWIVTGLTNGSTYYFHAAANVGVCGSSTTGLTYSAAEPSGGLLIGALSTGSQLSGTVTFTLPTGVSATGKTLYVGCHAPSTGSVYLDPIVSPVSPQAYSLYVPNGTACQIFGFIDLNNAGLIGGAGEISNTSNGIGMISVTVNGAAPNQNITLPSGNSTVEIQTDVSTNSNGTGYGVGFHVYGEYKLPVAVEILSETPAVSGTVADVVLPVDIATDAFNNYNDEFDYWPQATGTPVVGDSYTFKITYSDGTSEQLPAAVTGVLSASATNLSPTGTGVSLTPSFSWVYPSSASSYLYQFQLSVNNGNTVWAIPQKHSSSNGFASTISPFITWDVDPTNSGDLPSSSYLTNGGLQAGTNYNWSITAYDANMNQAQVLASFTTTAASLALSVNNKGFGPALAGYPFTGSISASGGSSPYTTWTVNGTSITATSLGSAMAFSGNDGLEAYISGSTLYIVGTPTTAESSLPLNVTVTDSTPNTVAQNFTLVVSSGPGATGVNNALLSGTYVCKFDGYMDSDGSRWSSLTSFMANGTGGLTSGVWDMNSRDFSAPHSGTISSTSTYSVGADNMGIMTINAAQTSPSSGTNTNTFAIALNDANGATTTATEFRMVEIDDVGTSPSGQHGSGVCYQATTSAFASSTVSGGFVFSNNGESGGGFPSAGLGLFNASNGTVNSGYFDGYTLNDSSEQTLTFTGGSITTPDSNYGRSTLTLTSTSGPGTFAVYVIDANRMFIQMTNVAKAQSGDMRKQQQTADTAAVLLDGSSVLYSQGVDGNSSGGVSGYNSMLLQVSAAPSSTYVSVGTVNQDYGDDNGCFDDGGGENTSNCNKNKEDGITVTITLDSSNPGRATFSPGGSDSAFFYFFKAGSALYLDLNGANHHLETGWLEAQTQPSSLPFANANIAGKYVSGQLPRLNSGDNDNIGVYTLDSIGGGTGSNTLGNAGSLQWNQLSSAMGYSIGYSWLSTAYGAFSETMNGTASESCIDITPVTSGATGKAVCIENTSQGANVTIMEQ